MEVVSFGVTGEGLFGGLMDFPTGLAGELCE